MKISTVNPTNNQKSFYNKAVQIELEDRIFLKSYDTIVCFIDKDQTVKRLWPDYSATTMKHVNSFLENNGLPKCGKKEWLKLETVENPLTYYEEKEIKSDCPDFTVSQNIYFNPFLM